LEIHVGVQGVQKLGLERVAGEVETMAGVTACRMTISSAPTATTPILLARVTVERSPWDHQFIASWTENVMARTKQSTLVKIERGGILLRGREPSTDRAATRSRGGSCPSPREEAGGGQQG